MSRLSHPRGIAIAALVALRIVISSTPAFAAWPHDPGINLPICTASTAQFNPAIVADGAGGAIITWIDYRTTSYDIYAQHVLPSGAVDPAWPVNGRALCNVTFDQAYPTIVSDGAGGAIVAWQDARTSSNWDIYAQHVLSTGVVDPAWPANGRGIGVTTNDQVRPTLASDGAGGAIISWYDFRNGVSYDIYAQHVLSTGVVDPGWPANGRALCTAINGQLYPTTVSDGSGGAVVAWQDSRVANQDIYAQHVLPSGVVDPAWPADGRLVCGAANDQWIPVLVADGSGGAIVTWFDYRPAAASDIYAQHVLASGDNDPQWPADGRALCTAANNQAYPSIVADGSGGAIVAWHDARIGNQDIYAQHVMPWGAVDPAWPADGRALCTAVGVQFYPTIATDGAGGAIVTWQDARASLYNDIYAQHVLSTGAVDPSWPVDGRALCVATDDESNPVVISDGSGGAIAAWQDYRSGTNVHIYAQRVARFGYLGTPEAEIINVKDVPGDEGGKVKLSWYASWLDPANDSNLNLYEIYRSAPPNLAAEAFRQGAYRMSSLGDTPPAGKRAFYVGRNGAQVYAWEFLANVGPAHYLSAYSYIASTTGDSTGAYNPRTAFMVVAQNYSGSIYWLSRPDSGYSVDNLPPYPPAPFTGQYSAGVAHLHWGPNSEIDLANYRLYRGTSSGFTPSPANRIAAPADTAYDDPAGTTYYYKLSAIDVHGNESGFTALLPAGTLDSPADALPRMLALERPAPNPASVVVAVRYALPREGPVTLAVYDAAGRRVRALVSGPQPAGNHTTGWDLRDDTGRLVEAGLYFVWLEADGQRLSRRFATLR